MTSDAIKKINLLTGGNFAKEYFTKNGLKEGDINEIKEILTKKINENNLELGDIEKELQSTITEYRFKNKIITKKEKLSENTNEKELIFKLNSDLKGFVCPKCNQPVIDEFNFCPKCGNKVEIRDYKLMAADNVDLSKGFVTPNELGMMRFVSPEEAELIKAGNVNPQEVGIEVTENNCPFDIRYDIHYNENFRKNKEFRKKIFTERKELYNRQDNNFKIIEFNQRMTVSDKKYPLKSRLDQQKEIKEHKLLKREFLPTPEVEKPEPQIPQIKTTPVEINLEYAGVIYLLDVLKHPKSPKLSDSILSALKVSSNKKIINYLRKNNLLVNAEGLGLVEINLQQKKVKDLKKILSKNNLQFSGNKDDIINYLIKNLPQEELAKYAKGKALQVTQEGQVFLYIHPQVGVYIDYLKNYPITDFEQYYQENKHLNLKDLLITYLEKVRTEFAQELQWHKFSNTYLQENRIYKDINDINMELETTVNLFICTLNPWTDNSISLQYSSVLYMTLQRQIIKLKNEFAENIIHEVFINKTREIQLPGLFIEAEEMFDIFMRISEDNLEDINKELESKFDTSQLKPKDTRYKSEQEQEEVFEKVKSFFK